MNKRIAYLLPLLFAATLACGTAWAGDYQRPTLNIPAEWKNKPDTIVILNSPWWERFNDATLNKLVEEVLAKNNDLAVAALKVKEARLRADLALDQFLPDMSASASATNSRELKKPYRMTRTYSASANATYEVDLWGKLASQMDSADWEAEATEDDRQAAAVSLIGTTVNLYWKIAYLNERLALSQESIEYLKKTLDLAKAKHGAGATSAIDEAAAAQSLAAQEAAHEQYAQQKVEASNALDILFDGPPGTLKADPAALPKNIMPDLAENTPAALLERRPDVRAAERRLRESLSDSDATRASYMPSISLTGSLGSASVSLAKILTDPVGALGAGIALPFLNWFDMRKNIDISDTQYEEAVAAFRQTVYNALADVENALSARARDAARGEKLAQAASQAKKAEDLYGLQYKHGYAPLQTLLDAQEKRRTAYASVLENRYTQFGDLIALYNALGGD